MNLIQCHTIYNMKTDGTAERNFLMHFHRQTFKFFLTCWLANVKILHVGKEHLSKKKKLKNKVTPMKFSPFCSLFRHTGLYGYHIWGFYIKIKSMLQKEKEDSSKYQESRKLPLWASSMWACALGIHWDSGFKITRFIGGILALGDLLTKLSVTS